MSLLVLHNESSFPPVCAKNLTIDASVSSLFIVVDQDFQPGPQTHVRVQQRIVAVPHQLRSHARRAVSYA
jgi:hypothetical protein